MPRVSHYPLWAKIISIGSRLINARVENNKKECIEPLKKSA
jgi:hypothetical protein